MERFIDKTIKKSAFTKYAWWVGSYSIVILVSILINLAGYGNAITVIEQELSKTNASAIEHTKNSFDNYLDELNNISYNLIQSNSVTMLNNANITPEKRSEYAGNIIRDIRNSEANSRILKNIYLVLRSRDICVDTNGIVPQKTAFQMSFSNCYPTQEAWLTDIFNLRVSGIKIVTESSGKQRLFLCRALTEPYFSLYREPTAVVMVEIDDVRVNTLLASMKSAVGEELYIVSNEAGLLFASRPEQHWPLDLDEPPGTSTKSIFGQKCVVSITQSEMEGLQYVRVLPNSIYLKGIRSVRTAFVLCYLLCIILGGLLVWLFSWINERNKRRMEEKIAAQNLYMREEILRQLLEGKLAAQQADEAFLAEYHLHMPGMYYVVSVIDPVVPEDTDEDETAAALEKIRQYAAVYLPSMLEAGMYTYSCMSKTMLVVVFNLQKEKTGMIAVCNVLSRLRSQMREDIGLDFICAVSRGAIGIEGLPEAFDEALEAMNSRFLGQKDAIFIYDDDSEFSGRYEYSVETERKLMNFLSLGDRENAVRMVEEIFSYNLSVKRINLSMLRVLTSEIISSLLKVAAQIDSEESLDFKDLYLFSTQIHTIKQIDQAKGEILKYIHLLCNLSSSYAHEVGDARCNQILQYIEEHYADPDMNVSKIADVFGITVGWMSKYFKGQVGSGMTDYIIQFRLKKAKEKLRDSSKTVKQVAEEVGFSSATVFLRAFKRYEGITPGQYRELVGREDG